MALDIAVVSTSASGFLTAWQFGVTQPTASSINYGPGQVIKLLTSGDHAAFAWNYSGGVTPQLFYSHLPATNAVVSITDNQDGTFTLTFIGTPQAQYYVVTQIDPAAVARVN